MRNRREATNEAVHTLVRVWREGGTGTASLPDPKTGSMVEGTIDQTAAEAAIAQYLDSRLSEIGDAIREGASLSARDKRVFRLWQKGAPFSFSWVWTPDDRHFLAPFNEGRGPCSAPHEWQELAAHPSEYDVGWDVPSLQPDRDGFRTAIITLVPRQEDRSSILTRWTRLDALDAARRAKRRGK